MGTGDFKASACGERIRLVHNDPEIANVISLGFTRLAIERSTDGGLTYEELTDASSRVQLAADTVDYVYADRLGSPDYYYRTRYVDPVKNEFSDPSDAQQGRGLAIRDILTPFQLKQRYLFGLDLTDDSGNEIPDAVFEHYILAALRWFEQTIDIPVIPTTYQDEMEDYMREDYAQFNLIQLENYPVLSVDRYDVQYPSGQRVVEFPQEWVRVDKNHGILRIVPTAGTLSEILVGAGGSYLPAIYNGMRYLPDLFAITYTAGFAEGQVPQNIVDIIGKVASMGPFNILGDIIVGAGIANISLSIDGLSQTVGTTSSATNAGYGARLIQYAKEVKTEIPNLRRYYKGIRMQVM